MKTAFGCALRSARVEKGLTQQQLAQISGIHFTYISQLERGVNAPTIEVIAQISDALNLPWSTLVQEAQDIYKARKETKDKDSSRLLLVEDDPASQKLVQMAAKKMNLDVDTIPSGHKALEKVYVNHYDLILMDIGLDGMDGLEATELIRSQEAESDTRVPIIAFTGNAHLAKDRLKEIGMDDIITKPCTHQDIQEKIQQWLAVAEKLS